MSDREPDQGDDLRQYIVEPDAIVEGGSRLPDVREPLVTMDAVRLYAQNERRRVRKILLGISSVFLAVALIIFAVFLTIGIFVLDNTRTAQERIQDLSDSVDTSVGTIGDEVAHVASVMGTVEEAMASTSNNIVEMRTAREEGQKDMQVNLENFSEWIAKQDSRLLKKLKASERRTTELEHQIAGLSTRYSNAVTQIQSSSATAADRAVGVPDGGRESKPAGLQSPESSHDRDSRDGLGTVVTLANGDSYQGQTRSGVPHGVGTYRYNTGDKVQYTGHFKEGKKYGRGVLMFRSGARYEGAFVNDVMQGQGTFYYKNGDRYGGEFKDSLKHGTGSYAYKNGDLYEGRFTRGLMDGPGILRFASGDTYSGGFRAGAREGKATYVYATKGRYIGHFKAGKRHGKGRYEYPDGDYFEGEFLDGKKEGFGVYTFADGAEISGIWRADQFREQ